MAEESTQLTGVGILGADDITSVRLEVPEWGGHLYVRVMTGRERDHMENECQAAIKDGRAAPTNFRSKLAVACCCDDQGQALFTAEQVDELAGKSAAALDLVFEAAMKINAMTDDDVEELAGK